MHSYGVGRMWILVHTVFDGWVKKYVQFYFHIFDSPFVFIFFPLKTILSCCWELTAPGQSCLDSICDFHLETNTILYYYPMWCKIHCIHWTAWQCLTDIGLCASLLVQRTCQQWRHQYQPITHYYCIIIKLMVLQLFSIFSSLLSIPAPPPQSSITADDFAAFFDEKIADIRSSFTSTPLPAPLSVPPLCASLTPCLPSFSPLTDTEVSQLHLSHRPTTCALDPIPSALLQAITPDIFPFITSLVNSSLSSGCFPSSFKKAYITPLLKKPTLDPSTIQNYRPVSLLPFLSKTIERAASNQLSAFFSQNNLLDPHQSVFRLGHSTETALLAVKESLQTA